MRALLLAITAVVLAAVMVIGSVFSLFGGTPPPSAIATTCQATLGPTDGGGEQGAAAASKLDAEARAIVASIIRIGGSRGLSPRAWQIAIQAGMTESGLHNLNHGDRDSVGIFQMRTSQGWGSPAQLSDVDYQINKFYEVLLALPGWDTMRPGDAAQAVERSAFPERYHAHEAMAAFLVSQNGGVIDASGCGEGVAGTETAQRVIDAAKTQLGVPYAWGGGNAQGPTLGISDGGGPADSHGDYKKVGFDCSGLVLFAYASTGITMPRVSEAQYSAGAHVPVADAQPGDLLFWADSGGSPSAIHHVAIYLGNGKIIEAPQSGDVVKISDMSSRKSGLVASATRPGAKVNA